MTQTDFARQQMIYHQIRPWDVLDERILDTLARIPRELFVPEKYRKLAFADTEIPLHCGQTMLKPILEGRLLQELDLREDQRALVIGTGSGYTTACVAALCDQVTSIDLYSELTDSAATRLAAQKIRNVELQTIDFNRFVAAHEFDRILVTGSMPFFDERLPEWLKEDGKMMLIVGSRPAMHAERVVRSGQHYHRTRLFETVVQSLENVPQPEPFNF